MLPESREEFHETKLDSGFIKTREPYAFKLIERANKLRQMYNSM
jgi:hypothetical protein